MTMYRNECIVKYFSIFELYKKETTVLVNHCLLYFIFEIGTEKVVVSSDS